MMDVMPAAAAVLLVALVTACGSSSPRTGSTTTANVRENATVVSFATVDPTLAAQFGPPLIKIAERPGGGRYLTDLDGKTVYIYSDDGVATGISACTGNCAATWPAVTIAFGQQFQIGGLAPFGEFLRPDGQRQIMYKGKPLYLYTGDKAAGDTHGDGVDHKWSIAVP